MASFAAYFAYPDWMKLTEKENALTLTQLLSIPDSS